MRHRPFAPLCLWALTACHTSHHAEKVHHCDPAVSEFCEPTIFPLEQALITQQRVGIADLPEGGVAYNAGILHYHGVWLMAFRLDTPARDGQPNAMRLGMVALDTTFRPVGPYSLLDSRLPGDTQHTAEDPRLFAYDDAVYLLYNDKHHGLPDRHIHVGRVDLTPLAGGGFAFSLRNSKEVLFAVNGKIPKLEKNWTPFVYQEEVHLIYQNNPPWVLKLGREDLLGDMRRIAAREVSHGTRSVRWSAGGTMRGGTQAVYEPSLDRYVTIFHSRVLADLRQSEAYQPYYFMGLYTFQPRPPFEIDRMIPLALVASTFYRQKDADTHIVFPQGLVIQEDDVHISYGQDDRAIEIMTLDKATLFGALHPPVFK